MLERRTHMAAVALVSAAVAACGAGPTEEEAAAQQDVVAGSSDRYSCFTSTRSGCDRSVGIRKALVAADECKEGVDFVVTSTNDRPEQPLVMAFHGGAIEFGTAEIATYLSDALGWDYYKLEASPKSASCKEARWMHITANRFNEERALDLAHAHRAAVAVHGYAESNEERDWAHGSKSYVCVGGLDANARAAFIRSMNASPLSISGKTVVAYDASGASDETSAICGGLQGHGSTNVVNQAAHRGLQLELPALVRKALAGMGGEDVDVELRARFTAAVEASSK